MAGVSYLFRRLYAASTDVRRYQKHHPNATHSDLRTLKHFAEFIGRSTLGIFDPEGKATVQTVRNHFRRFVSGWNRNNPKSLISRDYTDSITNVGLFNISPLEEF